MRALYDPFVIFSVYRTAVSETQNRWTHDSTMLRLQSEGIGAVEVSGVYKGSSEASIMVSGRNLERVLDIAAELAQETVLFVHGDRHAQLIDVKTRKVAQELGQFQEFKGNETELSSIESYTKTLDGKVWIARQ